MGQSVFLSLLTRSQAEILAERSVHIGRSVLMFPLRPLIRSCYFLFTVACLLHLLLDTEEAVHISETLKNQTTDATRQKLKVFIVTDSMISYRTHFNLPPL